jgi:hypothetical protein
MIARIWRGAVAPDDGDAYAEYMEGTGIAGHRNTPGNRGCGCFDARSTGGPSS